MPHIDGRTGEVVIRIVYDGAPEAGKTTNVQQLTGQISLSRRGAATSPGSNGRRTEYFDWLDFSGGYLDGRRVRCQLVSVPGQPQLLHRRRYLLETADAIVFVADSREGSFEQSAADLSRTLRILDRVARGVPVGLVLQANKQDLPGAVPPERVAAALRVADGTPLVGSVASSGEGIMQTFVLAVRLATDRVRTLMLRDPLDDLPVGHETPDALHGAMLELVAPPLEPAPIAEPPIAASPIAEPEPEPKPESDRAERANPLAAHGDLPPLPDATEIASGHVWPPVKGRAVISAATAEPIVVPDALQPWAPRAAIEIATENWILHTSDRWVFDAEPDARRRLLSIVRALLETPVPEGRCVAVAKHAERWRLWLVTPRLATLAAEVAEGRAARDAVATAAKQWTPRSVQFGAAGVALQEGRIVLLALEEGEGSAGSSDPIDAFLSKKDVA